MIEKTEIRQNGRNIQWKLFCLHLLLAFVLIVLEWNIIKGVERYIKSDVTIFHQADAIKGEVGLSGYSVDGNVYTVTDEDPQIMLKDTLKSTNKVVVKFGKALEKKTKIQVYYQVEGEGLSEQNSRTSYIEEGEKEIAIEIPNGYYTMLRLDIDGNFELASVDFFGFAEKEITLTTRLALGVVAVLVFCGIMFAIYRKYPNYYRHLYDILIKMNRSLSQQYGYKNKKDFLCKFLLLYLPFAVVLIIFTNSRYINPNQWSQYGMPDGNFVTEVGGYTESEGMYLYNENEDCFITLGVGGNLHKVLLEMSAEADRDIPVSYKMIDQSGMISQKKDVIWKKGFLSFGLEMETKNYKGIQLFIPSDFSLNQVFYISETENIMSRGLLHLKSQVFLIVLLLVFMSISVGKFIAEICIRRVKDMQASLIRNRKNVLRFFFIIFIVALAGLVILKLLTIKNVCEWTMKSAIFCVLTAWLGATIVFLNKYFSHKVEVIGFITILLVGSCFAWIAPGNARLSWDDQIHYRHAIELSNVGSEVRAYSDQIIDMQAYSSRMNFEEGQQKSSYQMIDTLEEERCYTANADVNWSSLSSWVPYVPSAIGLIVARGIGMSYHMQFIAGRWMNTVLLAVLCYFAMRKLKNGKIVVLLIALIPTNIFIASNYTYDTWLIGWTILGLSLFMGELQEREKKITVKFMIAIPGCMCLATMSKMVYFPIIIMVLFMPKWKFKSRNQQFGYYAMVLGAMIIPFLLLYLQTFGNDAGIDSVSDTRGGADVVAGSQIDYIRNQFGAFIQTLYQFLKVYLNPLISAPGGYGDGYFTAFAYVAEASRVSAYTIMWTVIAGGVVHHEDDIKIPWWYRMGTICVYIGVGIICSVSMYVMYTSVGANYVAGCQLRYLLPTFFPVVYVLTRIPVRSKFKTFMEKKGLARVVDVILVGIMAYAGLAAVWDNYIMRY